MNIKKLRKKIDSKTELRNPSNILNYPEELINKDDTGHKSEWRSNFC